MFNKNPHLHCLSFCQRQSPLKVCFFPLFRTLYNIFSAEQSEFKYITQRLPLKHLQKLLQWMCCLIWRSGFVFSKRHVSVKTQVKEASALDGTSSDPAYLKGLPGWARGARAGALKLDLHGDCWTCTQMAGGLSKCRFRVRTSGWGLRFCISNELLGDAILQIHRWHSEYLEFRQAQQLRSCISQKLTCRSEVILLIYKMETLPLSYVKEPQTTSECFKVSSDVHQYLKVRILHPNLT